MTVPEKLSPLHQIHVDAGASFTDFAGWQMPVRYSSELEEHRAVRSKAALFDLSHMAEITFRGPQAAEALDYALAGKISAIAVGQAKYSLLLTESGGILDDVIVYRTGDTDYTVVANAGNRYPAAEALISRAAEFDVTVTDESDDIALVAVQGPASAEIVAALPELELVTPLSELAYYRSTTGTYRGHDVLVARTGYTGEDGFELYVANEHAAELWNTLMSVGESHGIVPAGLACRDTLRLEAGMPLYGNELSTSIFPSQAGLGRVVSLKKDSDFVGRAAIEAGAPADARILVGLESEGRRAGRSGYTVHAGAEESDAEIGTISSGALSPTLEHPIAMAYVNAEFTEPGTELYIDVRGKRIPATVVTFPFYNRKATA